jgi:hypothetical protein
MPALEQDITYLNAKQPPESQKRHQQPKTFVQTQHNTPS